MNYEEAFDTTLRPRYDLLTREELQAAERRRQGHLHREDAECYAMVDAFKLHRAHTDAFRMAIEERGAFLAPGETACVVDLGSGAGNVAAAFVEAWAGEPPARLTYVGVDPHSLMRRLGIEFLRAFAPPWLEASFAETVAGLVIPQADHHLVTLNYVLQQPAVSGQDLKDWAALLAQMQKMQKTQKVPAKGRTCLLVVSPNSISPTLRELDRTEAFRREITAAGLAFELHSTTRRMDRRMPRENGRDWIVQPARGADWHNVRLDRYEFLAGTDPAPETAAIGETSPHQ